MKKSNKKEKNQPEIPENYIELKEKTDEQTKHPTTEDFKKCKPKEIVLFNYYVKNSNFFIKYSWEKDGRQVN